LYASLYEQEQGRRRLAETMQKVGTALSISLNLGDVLNQILRQLRELLYFDRAAVLLRKGNWLEVMASHDFPGGDDSFKGYRLELVPDKPSSFWQVYSTKQPFKIDDMGHYPQWRHIENLPSPKSWLGVPLIYQNEVRGMLSIARQTVKPFSEQDVETAITFAAPAAVALENAQLYDQIKRFNEHLEYEVTNRTEALRDAYEQLEKLDRTKSDFISVTAHELRTPITVLKGYGQILEQDKEVMANQMRAELITGILSGAGRLHEIVNTMLIMVKIDSRQLKIYPKPLSLSKIIGKIATELTPDVADRQQNLKIDDSIQQLPPVEGEPEVLTLVFSNILVNAIKYTPDRGRIEVFGRAWHNDPPHDHFPPSGVEIVVRDTGIGIAPEAKELIFTKFYQTGEVALHSSGKTKFKGGGPGLGLALARGIIEAHRGQLWAESPGYDEEKCPGSEFHIVLPLHQR
jgi:signal transduction histidine kinase